MSAVLSRSVIRKDLYFGTCKCIEWYYGLQAEFQPYPVVSFLSFPQKGCNLPCKSAIPVHMGRSYYDSLARKLLTRGNSSLAVPETAICVHAQVICFSLDCPWEGCVSSCLVPCSFYFTAVLPWETFPRISRWKTNWPWRPGKGRSKTTEEMTAYHRSFQMLDCSWGHVYPLLFIFLRMWQ